MKPRFRGCIPQVAFCIALCGCVILIFHSKQTHAFIPNIIYSLTLVGMYGVCALYHRPVWSKQKYLIMKSLDHAAIFALIAGTATPICLFVFNNAFAVMLLSMFWGIAILGMFLTLFWRNSPKWVRALLYVVLGWFAIPFYSEIRFRLDGTEFQLLFLGGVFYTIGALVYSFKRPNPFPEIFGYHEIFHILVVIASACHFIVIYTLTT